jgi:DNA polymerase elongation subunit (family B)
MMMANLYGRKKSNELNDRPIWTGGGVWKVSGVYYADDMHPVGKLIKKWFGDRLAYKKAGDKREYTIKIILNTLYGILDNPYYIRVYDKVAAADCTSLGRQWIKYARKVFRDKGYTILYTDTDSLYIQDPFKDKDKVVKIKQEIIEYIKSTVAFPQETFTLVLENEIEHMFFFKGNKIEEADDEMEQDDFINRMKGLMKKNYIYVTKEKDVIIKNLGIRKKSNTPLSKKIFWEYLVPKIKDGQIKFSKTYIKNLINELLQKDISLMTLRKDVDTYESYAKSKTSLPAQIALKYGSGIWFLIPNIKNLGVGKGKSYCTVEEFNKHNLKYTDIDLSNVWNELEYFIKEPPKVNIFSFGEEK